MKRRKRILILITDAGLGHRKAAEAIAKALTHVYGDAVTTDIVNILDNDRIPNIIRQGETDYDQWINKYTELYATGFQLSDADIPAALIEAAVSGLLFGVVRDLLQHFKPDTIVVTHPICQMSLNAVFDAEDYRVPFVTVVTDLVTIHQLWFDKKADLCVVPTRAGYDLAIENGLSEEQIAVIGIPVDPAIEALSGEPAELRESLGWHSEMKTLLVVGGTRVSHLRDILHALNHANLSLQMVVVAGGDEAFYNDLQEIEWHGLTHIYGFVENLPTMMRAADAIMCKAGGLIVTESLAAELPLLLIDVLPGQEQGNADYVIEGGAAILAETPLAALETAYHWFQLDGELLAEKKRSARKLGRPHAARDIAHKIWHLTETP